MSEESAPEAVSVDAMAASLAASWEPPAPATKAPEPAAEVDPVEEGEQNADEEGEVEADPDLEAESDEDEPVEAVAPVDAPQWWDAEHKAVFATLTPEQQAAVKANEDKREAVTQKVKAESQEARKAALAEIESVRAVQAKLDGIVPDKMAEFEAKYKDIDWNAIPQWAAQNPEAANAFLATYNAERLSLEKLTTAQAEATRVAQASFAREQGARLQEIAPDLVKNPENLKALGEYAIRNGVKSEDLNFADAEHLVLLNKARLYDDMMAQAAAKPQKSATPPKQSPAKVPPQGQARPVSTSKEREVTALRNRVAQTRSREDMAALLVKSGQL